MTDLQGGGSSQMWKVGGALGRMGHQFDYEPQLQIEARKEYSVPQQAQASQVTIRVPIHMREEAGDRKANLKLQKDNQGLGCAEHPFVTRGAKCLALTTPFIPQFHS